MSSGSLITTGESFASIGLIGRDMFEEVSDRIVKMVFTFCVHILHLVLVILKHWQRADCVHAAIQDVHARVSLGVKLEPVVHLHPTGDTLIISGREVNPILCGSIRYAYTS